MMLHDAPLAQARAYPDRTALVFGKTRVSYCVLLRCANHMAAVLRRHDVKPGDRVALYLPKQPAAIATLLASSMLGAIYVPIDPGAPGPYARLIVKDCEARVVVSITDMAAEVAGAAPSHCVDADLILTELLAGVSLSDPPPETPAASALALASDAPACILYTSGTTGRPKGVVISHGAAISYASWLASEIGLRREDVILNTAPFHFDLSIFDIYAGLSHAATIVLGDDSLSVAPHRITDVVARERVSIVYCVPSTLRLVLDSGSLSGSHWDSVRAVLFGGEVFPIYSLREFIRRVPQARYINLYGPTETNGCLYYPLPNVLPPDVQEIPVGIPWPGVRATVLGDDGQETAPGEIGELHIESPSLMLGYWQSDGVQQVRRPYPTGDLVCQRDDGQFLFRGRRDLMLKVRGFRIEPEGVEAVLGSHDGIAEAAVTSDEDALAAVVVLRDKQLSALRIKQCCAQALPAYMVPHRVIFVDALPKRSNGKLDRNAVRALVRERSTAGSSLLKAST